jgi:TPP-dependent pyruvate/acetoin dehydrogenase alpha subunit
MTSLTVRGTKMAMGSKAFESPLISHARMRAMYRALVETRALSKRGIFAKGTEACWVGTAIDLKPGDLISQHDGPALVDHVLRVGTREAARAANAADVKRTQRALDEEKSASKAFPGTAFERVLCAVGQAMALRSIATKGVVMAYVGADELKAAEWKRVFASTASNLPLIFVCLPGKQVDLDKAVGSAAPVISVDAGDVVALYRVAQESIGRARAEGGMAVIECVATGIDPIKMMRAQLVKKGICTEAWVDGVEASFRKLIAV